MSIKIKRCKKKQTIKVESLTIWYKPTSSWGSSLGEQPLSEGAKILESGSSGQRLPPTGPSCWR